MSSEAVPSVAVVYGGTSAEAEVSVVSGSAVADALRGEGFAVTEYLVARDGRIGRLPSGHRRDDRAASAYTVTGAFEALGAQACALDTLLDELAREIGRAHV